MVRTQLYLPEDMYEALKDEAKMKKTTFAEVVRLHLHDKVSAKKSKKDLYEKYPILKFAGAFSSDVNAKCDNEIDDAIYNRDLL